MTSNIKATVFYIILSFKIFLFYYFCINKKNLLEEIDADPDKEIIELFKSLIQEK